MTQLQLFNTRTRRLEPFEPLRRGKVGVYTCGPTVYSYAHIGNMRAYINADTLRRVLLYLGYKVTHVMNITDVGHLTDDDDFRDQGEDKLEVQARQEGITAWDIARKYTEAFFTDAAKLNILRPDIICKATDHIAEQVDMVKDLEAKGYTYRTSDGIYFDTSRFDRYAEFAQLDVAGLQQGQRVDAGEKRSKTDFALWKFSPQDEKRAMEWDSPWGVGFPGWHIECSAMARRYLGDQFDIHTGGVDHIPIHHTNEIAQTECCTGINPSVRFWLHYEFLLLGDAKMSKSKGAVATISALEEQGIAPEAFRLLCLQSHYRKQFKFTDESITAAAKAYERLRLHAGEIVATAGHQPHVEELSSKAQTYLAKLAEGICDDLCAPRAVAQLFELLADTGLSAAEKWSLMQSYDRILGLELFEEKKGEDIPEAMNDLLRRRNEARATKNWAEADRLRDEISGQGYEILDGPEGSSLRRKL